MTILDTLTTPEHAHQRLAIHLNNAGLEYPAECVMDHAELDREAMTPFDAYKASKAHRLNVQAALNTLFARRGRALEVGGRSR